MPKPILSIIIPTFNYGRHISNCLLSIPKNNHIETIIVDDGSVDDTRKIVNNFIKKKSNYSYFYKKNGGSSSARNFGIEKAKGDFLLFLDADDHLNTSAFKKLISFLNERDMSSKPLIISDHKSKGEDTSKEKQITSFVRGADKVNLINDYLISKKLKMVSGAVIFPRLFFNNVNKYPEAYKAAEDIPINILALYSLETIKFPEPLMIYNHHSDSLRHQVNFLKVDVKKYVDYCFSKIINLASSKDLPEILRIKKRFSIQKKLSLSRSFYIDKNYQLAIEYYVQAILENPLQILNFSYFRKFIYSVISYLRLRFFTSVEIDIQLPNSIKDLNFDQIFNLKGNILRSVANRTTEFIEHSDRSQSFYIKKHCELKFQECLKSILSLKSPVFGAKNEFIALKKLQENRFLTITPIAFAASGFIFKKSFLITQPLEGMVQLDEHLPKLSLVCQKSIIKKVCAIISGIQTMGMLHRDLYLCHFWIKQNYHMDHNNEIYLIDLHRAVFKSKISSKDRLKELADFIFSVHQVNKKLIKIVDEELGKNITDKEKKFMHLRIDQLNSRFNRKFKK